jgi:hypothetical protein
MNSRANLLILLSFLFYLNSGTAQIKYSGKLEIGNIQNLGNIVTVDPGIDWRGYYLNQGTKGIRLDWINGININQKLFTSIGVSYLNFEGINGFSLYSDLEYIPLKNTFSPLLNLKIGYSHIWNQYDGGTKTPFVELDLGNYFKKSVKAASKKTKRDQHWRATEEVELWVLINK